MPPKQTVLPAPGEAPSGICECGCGEPTGRVSAYTRPENRRWTGYPVPFIRGHKPKRTRSDKGRVGTHRTYKPSADEIPSGICECGCGQPTPISNYTWRKTRHFKGYPSPFLRGHMPHGGWLTGRSGNLHPGWKGGRIVQRNGYVLIRVHDHPYASKQGLVFEHRLVMERTIGRYLEPTEQVHHKDGNRGNNTPENLELWKRRQPAGIRAADYHCHGCHCSDEAGCSWFQMLLALLRSVPGEPQHPIDDAG